MYYLIPSNPASNIASSNDEYSQLLPLRLIVCLLVNRRVTLCWKLLKYRSILGVSTHISASNSNNACVAALKNVQTLLDPPPPGSIFVTTASQLFLSL